MPFYFHHTNHDGHHQETSFIFPSRPMGPSLAPTPMMRQSNNAMIGSGAVFNPPGAPPNPLQPQSQTWLLKNRTSPAFAPPAPAEAAAMWSNHAALAAHKAKSAVRDIEHLRQSAIAQLNDLRTQAQISRSELRQETDAALSEMKQGSLDIMNNYALAKAAVAKMYKTAEKYAVGAYKMAQDVNDAKRTEAFANELKTLKGSTVGIKSKSTADSAKSGGPRTATSSFANRPTSGKSSFNYEPTGDPELDRVLAMIKRHVDKLNGVKVDDSATGSVGSVAKSATKSTTKSSSLTGKDKAPKSGVVGEVVDAAKAESAAASNKQMDEKIAKMSSDSSAKLSNASPEAVAYKYAGEIAKETLTRDASNVIKEVIESARQIVDDMTVKQVEAEGQINESVSQAEQNASDVLQNINNTASEADEALRYIEQLKDQALYANNAAGQAMAAQMAQAMGFPISAKGITSPFPPPPNIEQAVVTTPAIFSHIFMAKELKTRIASFI
jgi:hypothetical protein